jgi:lipopolysaccharide transport system ATP-binding protein
MADVAIRTDRIAKRYVLGVRRRGQSTLSEYLSERGRALLSRRARERQREDAVLWALRDLSIEVRHGEVVGLIGHNGAGKSTLLKILTRITEPTSGWGEVSGRVGSLLEVGTGFHPELTGRENIFLNGSILGMRRVEISRRFDEIVDFAEIERFLDTPVKRYSSGMSVRLAFAVAAHLEPEILLVDEVLAVGDAAFQRKSLGKMSQVADEGRTVVFVSHNLAIIQALCRRGILLEQGRLVADGPTAQTVDQYLRTLERGASADLLERTDRDPRGWEDTRIRRLEVRDLEGGMADVVVGGRPARVTLEITDVVPRLECHLTILDNLGQPVTTLTSESVSPADTRDESLGPRIECDIETLPLLPGRYRIDVLLKARGRIQDGLQAAAFFDVEPGLVDGRPTPASGDGHVVLAHRWRLPS